MKYRLPEKCLVLLIGASGSGKSTFAKKFFAKTEIVSSDECRGIVSDDENNQAATPDAFSLLHTIVDIRLKNGRLTVVDATNVQPESRKKLIQLADQHYMQTIGIVFNYDIDVSFNRNQNRPERQFGRHVVANHVRDLRRGIRGMHKEGLRHCYFFNDPNETDAFEGFDRVRMWPDRSDETGPFDIIGDVHGCFDETLELLTNLGYHIVEKDRKAKVVLGDRTKREKINDRPDPDVKDVPIFYEASHPEGRKAIFVGDLTDRGPNSVGVLKLVLSMIKQGCGYMVPGNHDEKLYKKIQGRDVQMKHGLQETWDQLSKESPEFIELWRRFYESLPGHLVFDGGRLAVAHAGVKEEMIGRAHGRIRSFAHYGETTGEIDEFGLPVRYQWALDYRGRTAVVFGHTPVPEAEWLNETIDIDTGCVFGGKLTALQWPEKTFVSVDAKHTYAEAARPFPATAPNLSAQHEYDDVLDLQEIVGRRHVVTRDRGTILVREENATAALEIMSRFAANPKWLIYLPPTMSPVETSTADGYLERPEQAYQYFQSQGVEHVICEEKHMGSRAVAIVCRDHEVARQRFGVADEQGIIYTRTGRRFFDDLSTEQTVIGRVADAVGKAGLWDELKTDWIALDCELMPWSAKAQALIDQQYAPVGDSATTALNQAMNLLSQVQAEGIDAIKARFEPRLGNAQKYVQAYRNYCWDVKSIEDYHLAPFHILATESGMHFDRDHLWHMDTIRRACDHEPILFATPYRVVHLEDPLSSSEATAWWEDLVAKGGEGMVVKPMDFTVRGPKGLVQPALKVRGPEYLRIIYGPDYLEPENIVRLRKRGINAKRSLALREFALGAEGLRRFIEKRPLRNVHECVFGVLALESEPVDPRL
ncbi:MAG: polynucleotide kinase-phosphatase [Armatimonadetes bacterium]|nr:polynucleotide kinase-phosphatase [Armatimonadota bacterium]